MVDSIRRNESGVVLITVIAISFVMMVLTLSLVSINRNQITSGQRQIERLKAEQLAKGYWWRYYLATMNGTPFVIPPAQPLNGKNYTISVVTGPIGLGPNGTTPVTAQVTYPDP